MRLSTVFELLVIALLIAFAASRVIDGPDRSKLLAESPPHRFTLRTDRQRQAPVDATPVDPPPRHCTCSSLTCNCCRDFALPVVPIKGPGCATLSYLRDDHMMITMSFGDRVLRNVTISSKKPKPICMGMPGGISKFCGKLYSIKKEGENFKACLALELRALDDVEAALRVSCFKFGPSGVTVEPGEALPAEKNKEDEDEDDDDDYGLGELDDDDDDDDDDFGLTGGEEEDDDVDEKPPAKDTTYNDVDSSDSDADEDYTGLGTLSDELFGGLFGGGRPGVIDDDDDDDDDDDEDDEYISEPEKAPQPQSSPQNQQPPSQVNLVVMQPVIVKPPSPIVQKRPVKKPAKVETTSPSGVKKVRPTSVPLKTSNAPIKTLGTSTTPSLSQAGSTTPKAPPKKKKKPVRTRRPASPKPSSTVATEATPNVITATTMTVNVVQGEVNLNETKPQKVNKPVKDATLKIPMSKPVVDSKPMESVQNNEEESVTDSIKNSFISEDIILNGGTEKVDTEINEVSTQTIMHNTIPVDETIDDGLHVMNSQRISNRKPIEPQNDEDSEHISTTPNSENNAEEMTYPETTEHEMNLANMEDKDNVQSESEITEKYAEEIEMEGSEITTVGNKAESQALNPTTAPYMEEGTDKTETIKYSSQKEKDEYHVSDEDSENDEDDDEDIDIGADLGLEDDDDEEEEDSKEPTVTIKKPKEREEYDESDVVDAFLGNDEDDDKEEKEEDRKISHDTPYQINQLLFRLARISSGSIATARHLPRFSEGRNRRNNKRMRFPSLEVAS